MAGTDLRSDPDQGLLDSVETEGDGSGIGPTLGPDVSTDTERREIERQVFRRRTATDRGAEAHWEERPVPPIGSDAEAPNPPAAERQGHTKDTQGA